MLGQYHYVYPGIKCPGYRFTKALTQNENKLPINI